MNKFLCLMFVWLHVNGILAQPSPLDSNFRFTKEQVLHDFDSLHQFLKQTHPQLYLHSDSALTEMRWRKERKKINTALSISEFENIISPLVAQYNDGHTYIDINFESLQSKGACLFPYRIIINGDKIYFNDSVANHPPGTEVESINGIKAPTILDKILSVAPGDYPQNKEATAARLFAHYYGKYFGYNSYFNVKIAKKKSAQRVNAIDLATYYNLLFPSPVWTLKLFDEYKLAVIECTNYQGKIDKIRQKLDSFFSIIRKSGIEHLALDIRRNGGGNSYIGNMFLSYVSKKSIAGIDTKIYRQSPQLLKLEDNAWPKSQFLEAQKSWKKTGLYYEYRLGPDSLPALQDSSLRFNGQFYLLTSARTYSSAHITALQVKCSNLGTIIGQATGEYLNFTGETISYELPHTKIIINCPVAMYQPSCYTSNKLGVQPDMPVRFNQIVLLAGEDAEIEVLKSMIKK